MKFSSSNAVQADGGALGESGGAKPCRHCFVGGHLVGGDGWPLQRGQDKAHWDLELAFLTFSVYPVIQYPQKSH